MKMRMRKSKADKIRLSEIKCRIVVAAMNRSIIIIECIFGNAFMSMLEKLRKSNNATRTNQKAAL